MKPRKITVTFPDGKLGSRRTARAYTHAVIYRVHSKLVPTYAEPKLALDESDCPPAFLPKPADGSSFIGPRNRDFDAWWKARQPLIDAYEAAHRGWLKAHALVALDVPVWKVKSWHSRLDLAQGVVSGVTYLGATTDSLQVAPVNPDVPAPAKAVLS